jgi:hypothetical protein
VVAVSVRVALVALEKASDTSFSPILNYALVFSSRMHDRLFILVFKVLF